MIHNQPKYYYDKKTLSYKKINAKDNLFFSFFKYMMSSLIIASIISIVVFSFFDSPKEKKLKREIYNLELQYSSILEKMENAELVLDDIQKRDDNIYRVMFGVDPIDESIRKAGFGGVNRYQKYSGYNYSELIMEAQQSIDKLTKQLFIQSKSFDEVIHLAKNKSKMLASIPAIQPISNKELTRMASGFGRRIDPIYKTKKFHYGMDFSAPIGTPVYATGDGTIEKIKRSRSKKDYGNYILINHGYDYQSFYAHLDKVLVSKGKKVKRGDLIGHVGNTGKSTAPHLHYEVRFKKEKINPINFYHSDLNPEEYEKMLSIASQENQSFD
ncbi:MAG: peptidase M23 [Flavobacteriales bacterium]|jgi:murein DD-endopeptidase MepM/ murein hydrolase activator NlpD|nr:peptidase M23 [Flavobacteriales bacterium]|tara:strand:+ start:2310 stop:3290 length:981 start_codon:yes stop_codon:yes gene_type:complete